VNFWKSRIVLKKPGLSFLTLPKMKIGHFPYLALSKNRNPGILENLGNDTREEIPLGDESFRKFI
jgi:hypothetical protein